MESVFEVKCTHSKEVLLEMNRAYVGKKLLISGVALFVSFCIVAAMWYWFLMSAFVAAVLVVLGAFRAVWPFLRTYVSVKNTEKRYISLYDNIPESSLSFFDDYMVSTNSLSGGELSLEYEKIIMLRQSKNLYLLIMDRKLVVIVDKHRFEKGTAKEFEEFIKSKAIKAKNKF